MPNDDDSDYSLNLLWTPDYSVQLHVDTLITTAQLVAQNPDLVTRFLCATLKGWRTAVENPEIAVTATLDYAADEYRDLQAEMFDAVIPLVHTGADQIGWMRHDVWEGMYQMLVEQDLLDQPFDVINSAYTMTLLDNIYGDIP